MLRLALILAALVWSAASFAAKPVWELPAWELRGVLASETPPAPPLTLPMPVEAFARHAGEPALPAMMGVPAVKLRTLLILLHLFGLCCGIGGVFVLDVLLLKAMIRGRFNAHNVSLVWILSKTTSAGLAILWASGIGFLLLYRLAYPELLYNPKLWAKVAVVATLTLNGLFVHRVAVPWLVAGAGGGFLQTAGSGMRRAFLLSGALSAVSWYFAAVLGAVRELNNTLSATQILTAWAFLILAAFVLTEAVLAARRQRALHSPAV